MKYAIFWAYAPTTEGSSSEIFIQNTHIHEPYLSWKTKGNKMDEDMLSTHPQLLDVYKEAFQLRTID